MKKTVIWALLFIVVIVGGYWLFEYFTGNHINVVEVFNSSKTVANGEPITSSRLDKKWYLVEPSKVYFEVTTSQESVYSQFKQVQGHWNFDLKHPDKMTAEAIIDVMSEDSGNSERDDYIKSALYPPGKATFTLKSFDQWDVKWIAGQPVTYSMTGLLKIAGTEKEVQFKGETLYEEGLLKLKGSTVVKFADFGLTNPHLVTLKTQEDIKIILQLALSDKEPTVSSPSP